MGTNTAFLSVAFAFSEFAIEGRNTGSGFV
jgi:hypothetical protein